MSNVILMQQKGYQWYDSGTGIWVKGFLMADDGSVLRSAALANHFADCTTMSALLEKLRAANGMYAIVIQRDGNWLAAVDRMRTFPLFYRKMAGGWHISDNVDALFENGEAKAVSQAEADIFGAAGFTIGAATLLDGVSQIQPGEIVENQNDKINSEFHFQFAGEEVPIAYDAAKQQLKAVLSRVGERLVTVLNGRPVAVPLSGGLDSRLIVYLLHRQNYGNVFCFTYGKKQKNHELSRSQRVAEYLKYKWKFIDYQLIEKNDILSDSQFQQYYRYASQYCSKFYFSEYFAAQNLKDLLPQDAVIIPGHSGDTIAGSHLRPYMLRYKCERQLVNDLIYNHFNLVELTGKERRMFRQRLRQQLHSAAFSGLNLSQKMKTWILRERHGKYIINSCKMWEFMGHEFLFPLWDRELVDFFAHLPLPFRMNKKLYEDVLWDLFEKEGILFPEDRKTNLPDGLTENMKLWVKRNLPFIQPRKDIFANDIFDFQHLTIKMREDIVQGKRQRKLRNFNAIMNEWYLRQLEKGVF